MTVPPVTHRGQPKSTRSRESKPDILSRAASVLAVMAVAFLSFLAGGYVMYHKIFPADSLRRAFIGGLAYYSQLTGSKDPYQTPLWSPARTDGRGVLRHDRARAQRGLTLYSSGHEQSAFLIDMDGNRVHKWTLPYSKVWEPGGSVKRPRPDPFVYIEKAHVFPNGDLLALYTVFGDTPWGYGLVKMDQDSRIIWKYLGHAHHDFDIDGDGNIHVLTQEISDVDLPGRPGLEKPRIDDFIVKLSPDGEVLAKVWLSGAFAESPHGRRLYFVSADARERYGDYLHANSIQVLRSSVPGIPRSRPGQVLVSLREVSTIALVDLEAKQIPWATSGPWVRQHAARTLDNGNIILFDNEGDPGRHGISRVIEFDPETFAVTWSYGGRDGEPLESLTRSSQSRLANGNTLIVESEAGRLIEVTPDGQIVWEFVNPVRDTKRGNRIPIIFWVARLDPVRDFTPAFRSRLARPRQMIS